MQKLPPSRQVADNLGPGMLTHAAHLPPGGDAIDLLLPDETLPLFERLFSTHGDVFHVSAPGVGPIYVLAHPDDAARVLLRNYKNYPKGMGIDRVELLLGRGLMVTHGDEWKEQRKLMQPAFHKGQLGRYSIFINRCNRRLAERWRASLARGPLRVDMVEVSSSLALQFTLFVLFGNDVERFAEMYGQNPFAVVNEHVERDLELARKMQPLREVVLDLCARRQPERAPLSVLDVLLLATTDREAIADHLITLLVAGHETTGSAMASVWHLLAEHPHVAARVRDEADRVLGGRLPMFPDVEALEYTQMVIREALRLYPGAWILSRHARESDQLRDYQIPAGAQILVSPYLLHRHPDFWPEPRVFDPENFAPARMEARHRFAYIPFSAGPRNCIGDSLAMTEMALHLGTLVQHFDVDYGDDDARPEPSARLNLRWKSGMNMRVRLRERR